MPEGMSDQTSGRMPRRASLKTSVKMPKTERMSVKTSDKMPDEMQDKWRNDCQIKIK